MKPPAPFRNKLSALPRHPAAAYLCLVRYGRLMCIRLLIIALFSLGSAVRATEPCRPDHLTPVDPYPGDWHVRYTDLIQKHLLPPYRFFAAMIVRPSFEGEFSIVIHGTKEDYELD